MAASLERRDGGSVALFINGDLQFDSSDERIYHEALALPALALAARRISSPLKVLIVGGGDGLVAREIFKSSRVANLDLVDYDPEILAFARRDLSQLNQESLEDARITIHVQDAWDFVEQALLGALSFDVIVSDLTVAENVMEARFHSIDWYEKLKHLLSGRGILAVNGVSPQATPQAYWSIFNSMLQAGLKARPYHISLPSFSASGYGDDWGFFMASPEAISAGELDTDLSVATPREFLLNTDQLRGLFLFPEELFAYQPKSFPALAGSDILLHYFNNSSRLAASGAVRDAFSLDSEELFLPQPDTGKHILPPELCSALAKSLHSGEEVDDAQPEGVQVFLHEVLDLMPSLQREQTSALIAEFLQAPAVFLQSIDLPGLVARLLRRAAELPARLVAELKLLQDKLAEWTDDQENLLNLGRRVVTVLILAIVVGNLLYPDTVYGKGAAAHTGPAGHTAGHHTAVSRGSRGGNWGGGWGGGTYYNRRYINNPKKGPMGPGPGQAAERDMLKNSLPQRNDVSDAEYIDENGNSFPARRYRTAQTTAETNAAYRLGPGTDILVDGHMAMPLTDTSYLLVMPRATHVIERPGGRCVISLQNDPVLLTLTTAEISRQYAELSREMPSDQATETALHYLARAHETFKSVAHEGASLVVKPAGDDVGLFPGVSLTADGRFLAIARDDGQLVYLDGKNWYTDLGNTPLSEPYPERFRSIAVAYLTKMVRDVTATRNMLVADKVELTAHVEMLSNELRNHISSAEPVVSFGTRKLPREEAIRLTQLAVRKTERQIQALDNHIQQLPGNVDAVRIALAHVSDQRNS